MSTFHQLYNTIGDLIFNAYTYSPRNYYPHIHKGFELIYVYKGTMECTVDNKQYTISEDEYLLIFPYQIHSWKLFEDSNAYIVVFSESFVKSFVSLTAGRMGKSPIFTCSETTTEFFKKNIMNTYEYYFGRLTEIEALLIKSALYGICHDFLKCNELVKSSRQESSELIAQILEYIADKFTENISLYTLASDLGYSYQYLSKIFSEKLEIKFKDLLNQYRFEYAKQLLTETKKSITEIAYESGFQSIRNFNLVFSEFAGVPPRDYRQKA